MYQSMNDTIYKYSDTYHKWCSTNFQKYLNIPKIPKIFFQIKRCDLAFNKEVIYSYLLTEQKSQKCSSLLL